MPSSEMQRRRAAAGMTQGELAQRAGVSRALVSAVEAGRHLPRVDAALALARELGTSAEVLFGRKTLALADALTGATPAPGTPVRVGRVGELTVTAPPRTGDDGWDVVDGVVGKLDLLARDGVVLAGCEPGLALLERLLRDGGMHAMAVTASSAVARAALEAGRVHAAAVHFRRGRSPRAGRTAVLRVHLARWRVGLAAPRGAARSWWQAALAGRVAVVQREPGAAAQEAFERAARPRKTPIAGPRVGSHLAASRCAVATELPAVTIEPAAAAVGATFHPLETHEVELWVRAEHASEPGVVRLLDLLASAPYRTALECVGGYDLAGIGSRVA